MKYFLELFGAFSLVWIQFGIRYINIIYFIFRLYFLTLLDPKMKIDFCTLKTCYSHKIILIRQNAPPQIGIKQKRNLIVLRISLSYSNKIPTKSDLSGDFRMQSERERLSEQ